MKHFAGGLFLYLLKIGAPGLLVLGILDSSFLFAPFGNDLLLVALTARNPSVPNVFYYAGMSTIGSVLGCLLIDLVIRPLGAAGLERHLPPRRLKRIKDKVRKNAARAVGLAALAPPPFPFTAFIMAAAALQYSRKRLVLTVGAARMARFLILGFLALRFGVRILKWLENSVVQACLIVLIVVSIVGSVFSVYRWIKHSRSAPVEARA